MTHTITIRVDSDGNMTYEPALLRAHPGDYVVWLCPDGDFAVSFNSRSPFPAAYFHGRRNVPTAPVQIAENASGSYHYAVAVHRSDDEGRIWFNCGSPEIFV